MSKIGTGRAMTRPDPTRKIDGPTGQIPNFTAKIPKIDSFLVHILKNFWPDPNPKFFDPTRPGKFLARPVPNGLFLKDTTFEITILVTN